MKLMWTVITISMLYGTPFGQEDPPDQPHTSDPAKCTRYCHPKGLDTPPKGVPEGIPGYECQGDKCAKVNEDSEGNPCVESSSCTSWCSKVCCTCLAVCI